MTMSSLWMMICSAMAVVTAWSRYQRCHGCTTWAEIVKKVQVMCPHHVRKVAKTLVLHLIEAPSPVKQCRFNRFVGSTNSKSLTYPFWGSGSVSRYWNLQLTLRATLHRLCHNSSICKWQGQRNWLGSLYLSVRRYQQSCTRISEWFSVSELADWILPGSRISGTHKVQSEIMPWLQQKKHGRKHSVAVFVRARSHFFFTYCIILPNRTGFPSSNPHA